MACRQILNPPRIGGGAMLIDFVRIVPLRKARALALLLTARRFITFLRRR